jgi:hypothetical protein
MICEIMEKKKELLLFIRFLFTKPPGYLKVFHFTV